MQSLEKTTNERLEIIELTMVTKDDFKAMSEAFEDFVYAMKITRNTGKWLYRALIILASLVVAIVAIGGGFKTILHWFIK